MISPAVVGRPDQLTPQEAQALTWVELLHDVINYAPFRTCNYRYQVDIKSHIHVRHCTAPSYM